MLSADPVRYDVALFAPLLDEAAARDGHFMLRLHDSWIDGSERYDRPGEVLIGLREGDRLVGAGATGASPLNLRAPGRLRRA